MEDIVLERNGLAGQIQLPGRAIHPNSPREPLLPGY
jgi:hypothetical protein